MPIFIPTVIIMFPKKDGGIGVEKKAFRNRNDFLTTTLKRTRLGLLIVRMDAILLG